MEQRIIEDLEQSYGVLCRHATPVTGGWLNKKWKASTNKGTLLIKRYSNQRFTQDKIRQIDAALQRQRILEENGVPCPHILPCGNHVIRMLDSETSYMVMTFCPGTIESCDTVTEEQIRSLGTVCGLMHKEFAKLPVQGVKGYPIDGRQILSSLWENFRASAAGISTDTPEEYKTAVSAQEGILHTLTPDFFDKLPKGIAHEDFTPDNMLFHEDRVSAILDFDRNQYSFLPHDIGRAILSLALKDAKMDPLKTETFINGYSTYLPLTAKDVADALRITWCIEVPWWIHPAVFAGGSDKILRFKDEMLWLTAHWTELESLL